MQPNPHAVYSIWKGHIPTWKYQKQKDETERKQKILHKHRPKTSPVYHSLSCTVGVVEDIIFKGISDSVVEIQIEEIPDFFFDKPHYCLLFKKYK